jgi:hypothetical protein
MSDLKLKRERGWARQLEFVAMKTDPLVITKPLQLEPVHVTIPVGCANTGDSRTAMYDAIAEGKVRAVKEGFRTLLVFEDLKKRAAERPPAIIGARDKRPEQNRFRKMRELALSKRKRRQNRPRKAERAGVEA